jgi:hypothetical protein
MTRPLHGRIAFVRNVTRDVVTLLAASLLSTLVALLWLLQRSNGGALDLTATDAVLAASFAAAALPAWTATRWYAITRRGGIASPGVARWRRALWFALHPITTPAWAWLAALLAISTMPVIAYLALAMSVAVAVLGIASLIVLLAAPRALAVHTWLALLGGRT